MNGQEIIEVLSSIDGDVLSDKNGVLTGIFRHLSENGLYFVTYKDHEHVMIVSGDIQTIMFDLDRVHNYDIEVKRNGRGISFELDMEHDPEPGRDADAYYKTKNNMNLIRVLQEPTNPVLEANFETVGFKIKKNGKELPALLFSVGAIK